MPAITSTLSSKKDAPRQSLLPVETAIALAVLEYNMGPWGFEQALLEMKMEASRHHESHAQKATQAPTCQVSSEYSGVIEISPQVTQNGSSGTSEQWHLQEKGPTYAAGLF